MEVTKEITVCEVQEGNSENEMNLRSTRQEEELNQNDSDFVSDLNTLFSENSCLTEETSRAINSEISSQMSRNFQELKSDLNSPILDAINIAFLEKVTPSIKNPVGGQNSAKNTNLELRSDGPHPSNFSQPTLRGTFGHIDCIQKIIAKWLRMLRKTSPD